MLRSLLLVAALGTFVMSCGGDDSSTGPEVPRYNSVTGEWRGDAETDFGGSRWVGMTLDESDLVVTGSYAIGVAGSLDPYWTGTVDGSRDGDSLALLCPGEPTSGGDGGTVEFLGELTGPNTIVGEFSGSGWSDDPIAFTRY